MTIAFVHSNKAFLPSLHAYMEFFQSHNVKCEMVLPEQLGLVRRQVEWYFMGTDLSKPKEGILKIHEYTSTSAPPFRRTKDFFKSFFNSQPDLRIFQNKFVKTSFNFLDKIPYCYRDVGAPAEWMTEKITDPVKEYDFIYTGELSERRKPETFIDCFTRPDLQTHSLLLLGKDYEHLREKYGQYQNIIFKGPVDKSEVRNYILRSRFGINYIPDQKPFSHLSSTKFLEYAACNIPIVTTNYEWIKRFKAEFGGAYFSLLPDLSNFTWANVINCQYINPDISGWTWNNQIRRSGVLEFLQQKFPDLVFNQEDRG